MPKNTTTNDDRLERPSHTGLTPEREAAISERLDRLDDALDQILALIEQIKRNEGIDQ